MPDGGLSAVLKAAYPQAVASLIRHLGDFDRAEDAVQDAIVQALERWPAMGLPDHPVAWLVTVGRNRAIDAMRRQRLELTNQTEVLDPPSTDTLDTGGSAESSHLPDDLLRLIFTCCHPVLPESSQIALTLKTILGFSVEEIGRALLAPPATVEKRLTRAKRKLSDDAVPYSIPAESDVPTRLASVQRVVYLLFNQGYSRVDDQQRYRLNLCEEAIRLARMLCRLFRRDPESRSLLALMLLSSSRASARTGLDGAYIPLEAQDRSLWDQARIREGLALIDSVYAARHPPGAFQLQAAISALHCTAVDWPSTDWRQIAALYERLERLQDPTAAAVIRINRAVAMAMHGAHAEALEVLEALGGRERIDNYTPYHAALAEVLVRNGRFDQARLAYDLAISLNTNAIERRHLEARRNRLTHRTGSDR